MRVQEKTNRDNKKNYRPYYDLEQRIWRVDFPDRDTEEGSLQYVASEFARTGLYFPYHDSGTKGKDYCGHAHEFDGIIEALLNDPEGFSIEGFESYYSEQERKMLQSIQERLSEVSLKICVMTSDHPLWDETISFAENCSWKAGPYLAQRMRNHEFAEVERVIVATENKKPVRYCTFSLKDELPESSLYSPFIGFVFVDETSRGRRISEKMISAASDYAKFIGYETIYILSGENGLYEKYGFVKIDDAETIYGTADHLYQKRLCIC